MGVRVIGCGKALPALEVPNEKLKDVVETNDEWISSRTGISSRRVSIEETCTDLAVRASLRALGAPVPSEDGMVSTGWAPSPVDPSSIDLLVVTTITPDSMVPNNASLVRRMLGCDHAIAFDLNAACTGFIYGLSVAESMMEASHVGSCASNPIKRALIVSSERLTRLTNWSDRNTCVLFGDGAGAAVLEWDDDASGILSTYLENTDDTENSLICKNTFDSWQPFDENGVICDEAALAAHREAHPDPKEVGYSYIASLGLSTDPASGSIDEMLGIESRDDAAPEQVILMDGQRVFKFAARAMEHAVREACDLAGISIEDLALIVPHQANLRIIEFAAKRLHLPLEMFQVSIAGTGNTSSSGVPMALADALAAGAVEKGDLVALVAFGGGLTSGASIVRI